MTTLALSASTFITRDPDWIFDELHDPRTLVSCVPGAVLTRLTGPSSFEARIPIGFGPIQSHFSGTGRITASDRRRRTAALELIGDKVANLTPFRIHMSMTVASRHEGAVVRMTFDVVVSDRTGLLTAAWLDPIACDLLDRTTRRIKQRLEESAPVVPLPPAA